VVARLGEGGTMALTTARTKRDDLSYTILFVAADISTAESCAAVVTAVGERLGGIDIIVHSVGGSSQGATHIGVAADHVVESFRNELYAGYKTSAGVAPTLLSQFAVLEEDLQAMGVVVLPMVEYEADDALASAAAKAAQDDRVRQVIICTPDNSASALEAPELFS
jgi:NAD(P)-dependent dehydrogenase (short-subunit alcohol dehydrogenase family)